MVRAWRWVAAGLVVGTLPACSLLKKPGAGAGDGGESEASAAVVEAAAAAAPVAANEVDVARYPDEKATAGSTLTTEAPADLRTEVGAGGKLVVVLKKGTEVDKLAEHSSHYLVLTEDPRDATRKLMGWASQAAFSAFVFHAHDAGAIVEGGVHPAGDGGAAPAAAADAGAAPATGVVCVKQSPPGKCPAGFTVNGALCRVPCKTADECKGPGAKCNSGLCYNSGGCN
jgi:hypothetical protein